MPLVQVTLAAGAFTEKQKHDLAARLTDVMVAFEGSEAFREVVWVLKAPVRTNGPARRAARVRGADGVVRNLVARGKDLRHRRSRRQLVGGIAVLITYSMYLRGQVMVPPDAPMDQVMAKLEDSGAGRALVAEDGEVAGIITSSDLTRWLRRWRVLDSRERDGGERDGRAHQPDKRNLDRW